MPGPPAHTYENDRELSTAIKRATTKLEAKTVIAKSTHGSCNIYRLKIGHWNSNCKMGFISSCPARSSKYSAAAVKKKEKKLRHFSPMCLKKTRPQKQFMTRFPPDLSATDWNFLPLARTKSVLLNWSVIIAAVCFRIER